MRFAPLERGPLAGQQQIWVGRIAAPVDAAILDRDRMPFGFRFAGPAIVEQADTTTWSSPAGTASSTKPAIWC